MTLRRLIRGTVLTGRFVPSLKTMNFDAALVIPRTYDEHQQSSTSSDSEF